MQKVLLILIAIIWIIAGYVVSVPLFGHYEMVPRPDSANVSPSPHSTMIKGGPNWFYLWYKITARWQVPRNVRFGEGPPEYHSVTPIDFLFANRQILFEIVAGMIVVFVPFLVCWFVVRLLRR